MIAQRLEVSLLLVQLLPELEEPLLLALADGVVLAGALAALEGVAVDTLLALCPFLSISNPLLSDRRHALEMEAAEGMVERTWKEC